MNLKNQPLNLTIHQNRDETSKPTLQARIDGTKACFDDLDLKTTNVDPDDPVIPCLSKFKPHKSNFKVQIQNQTPN